MNRSDLFEALAERHPHLTATDAEVAVKTLLEAMAESLIAGQRIEIRGFGSFSVAERAARQARNPRTGERVAVPPKRVPHFKPGKALREAVDQAARSRA
ncbi:MULTISPECIES: integration host factor subunit beta [unclassified Tepidimonas]|jgi:integration host factor subunit beta|uniref:integration host factor subunit beta n=1 Tax=unclassified Tepidimonas TaxID=2631705 RepID=UPI00262F15F1|nr:integration host factor subunit beta [Tepidimonas sp.]MDT7928115.1 integration host factor subunit beta [Tepidimonas sp.]